MTVVPRGVHRPRFLSFDNNEKKYFNDSNGVSRLHNGDSVLFLR